MGFTCSLLGHAYGDPETEREREERGAEVVEVTREVRECDRCGERTVVSENTEIRTARTDQDPADASEPDPDSDTGETAQDPVASDPAEDDGVILDDDGEVPEDRSPGEWPSAEDTRLDDSSENPPVDAAETESGDAPAGGGAEILDDEGAAETATPPPDGDADPAGTPDAADPDAEVSEATTVEAATEAPDARESAPTAAAGESVADVTGREWPDEGPAADDSATEGTGIAAAEPGSTGDGGDTVFVCPSCEFSESAQGSSHRQGDICPSCRRGYLVERTRN